MAEAPKIAAPKKGAPTLYLIVAIKLAKGIALLLTAAGIYSLAGKDLGGLFDQFVHWIHLDPENRFFNNISDWLDTVTAANVRGLAAGTFLYGLFLLVSGTGLAMRAKWAIWLTIGESAFFIPIEVYELVRRLGRQVSDTDETAHVPYPKIGLLIVLVINIIVVWYLLKNRRRLFRQPRRH
ncbi:MAG: DUF2127 domain-containing protein [Limisphaerales bacterium]